ncbi:hypothetical protein [Streptomyces sp. NPDC088925]|uniref:hypothetical protein n=1 Tax=Streptomyces sp. NPDC088925 TaxID=3365914 RepID=UPI0038060AC2
MTNQPATTIESGWKWHPARLIPGMLQDAPAATLDGQQRLSSIQRALREVRESRRNLARVTVLTKHMGVGTEPPPSVSLDHPPVVYLLLPYTERPADEAEGQRTPQAEGISWLTGQQEIDHLLLRVFPSSVPPLQAAQASVAPPRFDQHLAAAKPSLRSMDRGVRAARARVRRAVARLQQLLHGAFPPRPWKPPRQAAPCGLIGRAAPTIPRAPGTTVFSPSMSVRFVLCA